MSISSRQIALIKVAAKALGLTDDVYRATLVLLAGVGSCTDLDQAGFDAVMGFFEWKGFKPMVACGPSYGARPGMASFAQIELIRAVWAEWSHGAAEDALNKWLERCFKVSSLRFLKKGTAPKVIAALKAMKARSKAACAGALKHDGRREKTCAARRVSEAVKNGPQKGVAGRRLPGYLKAAGPV